MFVIATIGGFSHLDSTFNLKKKPETDRTDIYQQIFMDFACLYIFNYLFGCHDLRSWIEAPSTQVRHWSLDPERHITEAPIVGVAFSRRSAMPWRGRWKTSIL